MAKFFLLHGFRMEYSCGSSKNWGYRNGWDRRHSGKKYSTIGLSVLPADLATETADKEAKIKKLSYTYTKDGVETKGDIPAILWEEDFDGSKTMNAKAKNKYLYDVLMTNLSDAPKQENKPQVNAEAPKIPVASPSEAFEPLTEPVNNNMQELPF